MNFDSLLKMYFGLELVPFLSKNIRLISIRILGFFELVKQPRVGEKLGIPKKEGGEHSSFCFS
jgi:hypothetical protein